MKEKGIKHVPLMREGRLKGIISDRDIKEFSPSGATTLDMYELHTGVRHGGKRIYLILEDRPGSIKDVADIIRNRGFRLQSILTSYEKVREGYRSVVIRTKGKGDFGGLASELECEYKAVKINARNIIGDITAILKAKNREGK